MKIDLLSVVATGDSDLNVSYSIELELKAAVADGFARATLLLSKKIPPVRLANLVPGRVLAAPRLVSQIPDRKSRITGGFTKQEAESLATELMGLDKLETQTDAGTLPDSTGIRVQLLLHAEDYSYDVMNRHMNYDGVSILASGLQGTINGKQLDYIVAVAAHNCLLEAFEHLDSPNGKFWKATFFVPQGPSSDHANQALTQDTIDQWLKRGVKFKLDHCCDESELELPATKHINDDVAP